MAKARVNVTGVHNGNCKMLVQNQNFMIYDDVKACMSELKDKKCEGFHRIPLCIVNDACDVLLPPMADLFNKIFTTCEIPEQWKVSKIILICKKGSKSENKNYRPIANLCSASKIFEKLILKQIHYLESKNKLDLTGKQQQVLKGLKALLLLVPFSNL